MDEHDPFNLRSLKPTGFLYFVHKYSKQSKYYSPYELVNVQFSKIDKNSEYFTVSWHGVTTFSPFSQPELISLEKWHLEKQNYSKLQKISFFGTFIKWRAFRKWRKSVSTRKFDTLYTLLPEKLLVADGVLRPAIFMCRDICAKLQVMGLGKAFEEEPVALGVLMDGQIENLKEIKSLVGAMRDLIREQLVLTCKVYFQGLPTTACSTRPSSGLPKKNSSQAEAKPTLSYADQEKRNVLSQRLARFIRMLDCLLQNALHNVLLNSLKQFVTTVEERFQSGFYDTFERLPCLCTIEVLIEDGELKLAPSELEMTNTLRGLFQAWEDAVYAFELFSNDQTLAPYLRSNATGTSLENIITSDENIARHKSRMLHILQENYAMATEYMLQYASVRDAYLSNIGINLEDVSQQTDLDFFKRFLLDVQKQEAELDKIDSLQNIGILELRMSQLKSLTTPCLQEIKTFVNALLPKIGRSKVNKLSAEVQDAQAFLELTPKTTSNFVEFLHYLDKTAEKLPFIQSEKCYVEELFETMQQFNIVAMKEDLNSFTVFQKGLSSLQTSVEKRVEKRKEIIEKFEKAVQDDVRQLISEVEAVKHAANVTKKDKEPALLEVESDFEEVQLALHQQKSKLREYERKNEYFQSQKLKFQILIPDCSDLEDVKEAVALRQLLWDSLESWTARLEDWDVQPFHSLDPDELSDIIHSNIKIINQVREGLPDNSVIQKYQSSVEQMQAKLPVIQNLRNPNLDDQHWKEMSALVKHNLRSDQVLTLRVLEDMDVFGFFQELGQISIRATREAELRQKLSLVSVNLESLEFEMRVFKDGFLLNESSKFDQIVDETCIALGEIANSVFATPIQKKVDAMRTKFELFVNTLEKLWRLQKKWCKISAVFEPDEVQIKLAMENKMLQECTKLWKFIMDHIYNTSSAMEALIFPGILSRVVLASKMLSQIEKSLETYYDTKRVIYPRFFFLSNREMLNMWADASNPKSIELYLPKMFSAVRKMIIESGSDCESRNTGVKNDKNERILFEKEVIWSRKLESWLLKVEFSIGKTLKDLISTACEEMSTSAVWIEKNPYQVIAAARAIKLTNDVENTKNVSTLAELLAAYKEDLKGLISLLEEDADMTTKNKISSLIPLQTNYISIMEELLDQPEDSYKSCFAWQKQMRFYWKNEQKECLVAMGEATLNYGFEFVSSNDSFVSTTQSDRLFFGLFSTIQSGLANLVHGDQGAGKKYLLKILANILAINLIQIPCSSAVTFKGLIQILYGSIQSGAWCCFSNVDKLSQSTISVFAGSIEKILHATKYKVSRFILEDKEIRSNHNFSLFLTKSEGSGKLDSTLPSNLVKLFRPTCVEFLEEEKIVEMWLLSNGSRNAKDETQLIFSKWNELKTEFKQKSVSFFTTKNLFSSLKASINIFQSFKASIYRSLSTRFTASADLDRLKEILGEQNPNTEEFSKFVERAAANANFILTPNLVENVIQLKELSMDRKSIIINGKLASGKTTVWKLFLAAEKLHREQSTTSAQRLEYRVIYQNMLEDEEYLGFGKKYINNGPGLIEKTLLDLNSKKNDDQTSIWIIFDGDLEKKWLQYFGDVFETNGALFTEGGEKIIRHNRVHFIFETTNLKNAPPGFASRCNVLNVKGDVENVLAPLVQSKILSMGILWKPLLANKVQKICKLIQSEKEHESFSAANAFVTVLKIALERVSCESEQEKLTKAMATALKWSVQPVWSKNQIALINLVEEIFPNNKLKSEDYLEPFQDVVIDKELHHYFSDDELQMIRVSKSILKEHNVPFLIYGETGRSKTALLRALSDEGAGVQSHLVSTPVHGASRVELQGWMLPRLEKRSTASVGAPRGKRTRFLLDDFGAAAHQHFLRLMLDHGGMYDPEGTWRRVEDVDVVVAVNADYPPRQFCPRFLRHFGPINLPAPTKEVLANIYNFHSEKFTTTGLETLGSSMTKIIVDIFETIKSEKTSTLGMTLLDLQLVSNTKNRFLVIKNDAKDEDVIRMFREEILRIFGAKFLTQKKEFIDLVENKFLLEFGEELMTKSAKTSTCRLSEVIFESKICTHGIDLSLGETLQEHLGLDFGKKVGCQIKRLCFFNKFAEITLNVAKALTTEPKHVLLFGEHGIGKRTVVKTAAELLQYRTIVIAFEEKEGTEKLKSACLESLVSKQNLVVIANFENCDSVAAKVNLDVFNSVKYGKTSFMYEKQFILEAKNLIETHCKRKIDDKDAEKAVSAIADQVRKNLRLVVSVNENISSKTHLEISNYCFVQFVENWDAQDYEETCVKFLKIGTYESHFAQSTGIENCLAKIHLITKELFATCLALCGQRLFATFDMYVDFLHQFSTLYDGKLKEVKTKRDKCAQSIKKFDETFQMAEEMKLDLAKMIPTLAEKRKLCENIIKALGHERSNADKMKNIVQTEESDFKEKSDEVRLVSIEIQRELEECIPAIEASCKAIELIERNELKDVKSLNKPPSLLRLLMEPVCLLLDCKSDWGSAKTLASDPNFIKKVIDLDKENVDDQTAQKLKEYVDNPNFLPEVMESQSKFCRTMCMWVRSIYNYVKVYKNLLPKKKKLETTEADLRVALSKLKGHQQKLADIEAKVAALEMTFDQGVAEADALQNAVEATTIRLNRAAQLTTALQGFDDWTKKLQILNQKLENLTGDVVLCAATLIYFGPLDAQTRSRALESWKNCCTQFNIKMSSDYCFTEIMSTPSELHLWHSNKLLREENLIVSALAGEKAQKWLMLVDPQDQAAQWIKHLHSPRGLVVTSVHRADYLQHVFKSIAQNVPILLQDVDQNLPADLLQLLQENNCDGQRKKIDLFLATRLAKPNFGADIFSLVNVVDFTVGVEGLEEMFLSETVRMKALDVETQLNTFGSRLRAGKKDLEEIEAEMQERLCNFNGDLLDDEATITSLCKSKATIDATKTSGERQMKSWNGFAERKNQFKCVATSAAKIFCQLLKMQSVKPVYQFSFLSFKEKYLELVKKKFNTESHENLAQTIAEFEKISTEELLKLNLQAFSKEDLKIFSDGISAALNSLALEGISTVDQVLNKGTFKDLIRGMKKFTPMVIVLGQDVAKELRVLSDEIRIKNAEDGLFIISMGLQQQKKAELWLRMCAAKGLWIYFQNCHLCPAWLEKLDEILSAFRLDSNQVHEGFRLFYSITKTTIVPPMLIQSSIKVCTDCLQF